MAKQVVLVTGAGRGIGKEILLRLGKRPEAIAIGVDYNEEAAERIKVYLAENHLIGDGLVMDVTRPEMVNSVIAEISSRFGSVTILVNNAGITRDNLMLRMSNEEWNAVINTNLSSVFNVTKACLKEMVKERFGRIVNISSVVGFTGNAGQVNYSATKAGIVGFSKSLAQEVASRNITVNCVAPGFIDTAMTQKLSAEQREHLQSQIPMRKIGSVSDVVDAVEFLTGDHAAYITGSTIHVNGGLAMI